MTEKPETPHCATECLNLSLPSAPLNTSTSATLSHEQQAGAGRFFFFGKCFLSDRCEDDGSPALLQCWGQSREPVCLQRLAGGGFEVVPRLWLCEPLDAAVTVKCTLLARSPLHRQRPAWGRVAGLELSFRCWRIAFCHPWCSWVLQLNCVSPRVVWLPPTI